MSALNTLLQYILIVTVAYLYTKTPWNKKSSASNMRGAFGRLQASGLADYYSYRKTSQRTKEEHGEKSRVVENSNGSTKDASRDSARLKERSQQQKQPLAEPTPKKQVKASSSLKQKAPIPRSDVGNKLSQLQQHPVAEGPMPDRHGVRESARSEDMAAEHRRFLSEMFKDVPASEIDRVIRLVNWDVNEAATVLAQEDYTWQAVRRRRNGSSVEIA